MFIIVGLGNPTRQYEGTKHNVGFDTIDYLIDEYQIPSSGAGHKALFGKGMIAGQKVIVAKPMTYMNLSGECIRQVMDYYKVDPRLRIYALCAILGLIGWPGIARMVRGQILSLREQEFMIATEATGVRVSRRIFRHLIPNVIPQLIVIATMGLGDVILMEATLSFLGIGVKFPYASWGNIVNAVNDVYVLTNFWFVWIPAGILILLTVLGFNFVGDGLRDAFDPKMKR